jgi:hypothetical protein
MKKEKIEYVINNKKIEFKFIPFHGKLKLEEYETQIYKLFSKIGVNKKEISIEYLKDLKSVKVIWIIDKKKYEFKSSMQKDYRENLGSIVYALKEDFRQISRGIKTLNQILKQYEKEETKIKKSKNIFEYYENNKNNKKTKIDEPFNINKIKIDYIDNNEKLEEKYHYLLKYDKFKINSLYFKLKEECIKNNKLDHPMLKALIIVRKIKGYDDEK